MQEALCKIVTNELAWQQKTEEALLNAGIESEGEGKVQQYPPPPPAGNRLDCISNTPLETFGVRHLPTCDLSE